MHPHGQVVVHLLLHESLRHSIQHEAQLQVQLQLGQPLVLEVQHQVYPLHAQQHHHERKVLALL